MDTDCMDALKDYEKPGKPRTTGTHLSFSTICKTEVQRNDLDLDCEQIANL
jgi:hypothetical protein